MIILQEMLVVIERNVLRIVRNVHRPVLHAGQLSYIFILHLVYLLLQNWLYLVYDNETVEISLVKQINIIKLCCSMLCEYKEVKLF